MQTSTWMKRAWRIACVTTVAGMMAGLGGAGSVSAKNAGGEFTSDGFGFSVVWDNDVWTAEVVDGGSQTEGVSLESQTSWAQIQGTTGNAEDTGDCLDAMADALFANSADVDDFRVARKTIERPDVNIGGDTQLYTFAIQTEQGPVDMTVFLGCAPLAQPDQVLQVIATTAIELYPDALPEWEGLL